MIQFSFIAAIVLVAGGCGSMGTQAQIARKADEYLASGVTRDPEEALRMARGFYLEQGEQGREATRRERELTKDLREMRNTQESLDRAAARAAPP